MGHGKIPPMRHSSGGIVNETLGHDNEQYSDKRIRFKNSERLSACQRAT